MLDIKRCLCAALLILLLAGCKEKKVSLSGDDTVEVGDFIKAFRTLALPYRLTNITITKSDADSFAISNKVFTQFVPDSIFIKPFGRSAKPKIYSIGKVNIEKKETYLLIKAVQGAKKATYIVCFDKDNKFIAGMPFLIPDQSSSTQQAGTIDKNFTISSSIQRSNPDGTVSEGRNAFILNSETRSFMLIMTDDLDDKPAEVINPIDTLSRKNKFSGDYVKGKTDYISVRDSRKPGRILFFVHFEKNNGECTGELKGEAALTSANTAVYRADGDPCVLQLNFTSSSVRMKEIEACGSHRELRCLFEGSYPRKKEAKPKETKKKKTTTK